MNLLDKDNRFNIANLITFGNIAAGLIAIHFIVHGDFFTAIILAWIAGAYLFCGDAIVSSLLRYYKREFRYTRVDLRVHFYFLHYLWAKTIDRIQYRSRSR
jgi:hypothetical protein